MNWTHIFHEAVSCIAKMIVCRNSSDALFSGLHGRA